jgi:hypothetical protein
VQEKDDLKFVSTLIYTCEPEEFVWFACFCLCFVWVSLDVEFVFGTQAGVMPCRSSKKSTHKSLPGKRQLL